MVRNRQEDQELSTRTPSSQTPCDPPTPTPLMKRNVAQQPSVAPRPLPDANDHISHSDRPVKTPATHPPLPSPLPTLDQSMPHHDKHPKPTPCPKRHEADTASLIASASKLQLAALLQQVCAESRRARKVVERVLRPGTTLKPSLKQGNRKRRGEEAFGEAEGKWEDGDAGDGHGAGEEEEREGFLSAPKSKFKPRAVCRNCGTRYLLSGAEGGDGGGDVCVYHPGESSAPAQRCQQHTSARAIELIRSIFQARAT